MRFVEHLATSGLQRGLIGPREVPRLWSRHLLNCAVVADLVADGSTVADVGSGAGLPGIVLVLRRPDLRVVLIEPLQRRVDWLHEVVADLGLQDQVEIRRARAEQLVGVVAVPVVTARAVAPLDRLAAWSLPLLRPRGELLALKGATAQQEVDATAAQVRKAGGISTSIVTLGSGVLDQEVTVVRIRVGNTPPGHPVRPARRGRRGATARPTRPAPRRPTD
jgi:16S rRNA (guanine527-N7)-methyltransferase